MRALLTKQEEALVDMMTENVFRSKLEDLMPAEELDFPPTPAFGDYRPYLEHAVSHPAKANTKLLEFLILRYTKEGDVILDPMSGTGSTGVVAALHGRNAILVEIEPRFYEFIVQAKEKVEKVQTLLRKGRITCILGDARELSKLLRGIDTCITSPPYGDTDLSGGDIQRRVERLVRAGYDPREYVHGRAANAVLRHYGEVDAVITSPPYTNTANEDIEEVGKYRKGGPFAEEKLGGPAYGDGNISNLPLDPMDVYLLQGSTGGLEKGDGFDVLYRRLLTKNGRPTYLSEMLLVYREMHKVLKPGGRAIVIVKPFIKERRVVDLPHITYLLMAKVGFALETLYKLRLKTLSFWRNLYYQKNPDVPRIMHEYVLVCRKPDAATGS